MPAAVSSGLDLKLLEEIAAYFRDVRKKYAKFEGSLKGVDSRILVAQVPVMILQPLVENAIKHGIEPQTGLGLLKIAARHTGDLLQVTIGDNGPGLPGAGGTAFREGIGLANTRARLRELYGPRHQFTLSNAPAGGLLVFLEIPYHEQPASFRPD